MLTVLVVAGCRRAQREEHAPQLTSAPSARVDGYLAGWGVRTKGTRIAELPGAELTHIIYAFARITDDGRLALGDPCLDAGACDSTSTGARPSPGAPSDSARSAEGGNMAALRELKTRFPSGLNLAASP